MGKTHQALKRAEKEYINRQQQNILASRQKFSRKWVFYGTLAVLLIATGGISHYWGTRSRLSSDFKVAPKSAVSKTTKIITAVVESPKANNLGENSEESIKIDSVTSKQPAATDFESEKNVVPGMQDSTSARPAISTSIKPPPSAIPDGYSLSVPDWSALNRRQRMPPLSKPGETAHPKIIRSQTLTNALEDKPGQSPAITVQPSPTVEKKETIPDPGKLIEWVLQKRSQRDKKP